MFDPKGPTELLNDKDTRATLDKLNELGDYLKNKFYEMDEAVDCLMIAALTGEAMVMIGPPGTAKSRLVREFAKAIGLMEGEKDGVEGEKDGEQPSEDTHNADYFEYLLTQFTEPSELFGYYDLVVLQEQNRLERDDSFAMQKAQVVFLDEVFNASSAILNALLTFMNERMFHDRGRPERTNLKLLVSATNQPPSEPTLAAVYDRFLLRCWMHSVARPGVEFGEVALLVDAGWEETHGAHEEALGSWKTLLSDVARYQKKVRSMTGAGTLSIDKTHTLFGPFTGTIQAMVELRLANMTNRRIVKYTGIMLAHRLLRAAAEGESGPITLESQDLDVLKRYSLDNDRDGSGAEKIRQLMDR